MSSEQRTENPRVGNTVITAVNMDTEGFDLIGAFFMSDGFGWNALFLSFVTNVVLKMWLLDMHLSPCTGARTERRYGDWYLPSKKQINFINQPKFAYRMVSPIPLTRELRGARSAVSVLRQTPHNPRCFKCNCLARARDIVELTIYLFSYFLFPPQTEGILRVKTQAS